MLACGTTLVLLNLVHVSRRSDCDVVCETLVRLGGPRAVSALKDLARVQSGRLDHAVSGLIRLGQPGIKEILAIVLQGVLPAQRPQTRRETPAHDYSDWYQAETLGRNPGYNYYDRWTLAESVVRACMACWDLPEFSTASKNEIAVTVRKLLARRVPGQWDALRTQYFKTYLDMASKLPDAP